MPPTLRHGPFSSVRLRLSDTPGRIAVCFAAVLLSLLVAAAAGLNASSRAASTIRTIGSDAEPSVVLALQIGATLSDMEAAAADDALGGGFSATGTSRRWRTDKAVLDALVVQASRNITYGEETAAVQGLLRWIGEYQASLAEVRGAADPANAFFATQRLQWSHRLVTAFAQPEADALARENRAPLEAAYRAYNGPAVASSALAVVAAALVAATLAAVQVFLWRRTHRMVSPALALATLVAVALAAGLLVATLRERENIRIAKADCYDSLDPLFAAKGSARALDGNLSYWLLDPADRPVQVAAFDAHVRTLLDVDTRNARSVADLRARLLTAQRLEVEGRPTEATAALPAMGGLLGKELANVTFGPAERDPASDAVRALLDIVAAGGRVRALAAPERRMEAVRTRNADAEPALARLQASLDRVIAVNQDQFDLHVAQAQHLVGWTPAALAGALVLIGLLASAGLWPRYREYM